jgi:hypothetical protein
MSSENAARTSGPVSVPLSYRGWLNKKGRSNLFKNWKRRYFVLELGLISYYENDTLETMRGQMELGGATLEDYFDRGTSSMVADRIFINGCKTEHDMLIECETFDNCNLWRTHLAEHIAFANAYPDLVLHKTSDSRSNNNEAVRQIVATQHADTNAALREAWEMENSMQISSTSGFEPLEISPKPAFVIKVKKLGGKKLFINVCYHQAIPASDKKRGHRLNPIVVLGNERTSADKNGETCFIMDVILHKSVIDEIKLPINEELKEEVILKILNWVQSKDATVSDLEYTLPKMSKFYKGDDVVPTMLTPGMLAPFGKKYLRSDSAGKYIMPAPDGSLATTPSQGSDQDGASGTNDRSDSTSKDDDSTSSSTTPSASSSRPVSMSLNPVSAPSVASARPVSMSLNPIFAAFSGGADPNTITSTSATGSSAATAAPNNSDKAPSFFRKLSIKDAAKAVMANQQLLKKSNEDTAAAPVPASPLPTPPPKAKRHIPYCVSRSVGAVLRQKPDKTAAKLKTMAMNSRLYVNSIRVDKTGCTWMRCNEGWLVKCTDGGQRLLQPVLEIANPLDIKIISSTLMSNPPPSFWESLFGGKHKNFHLMFTIEIVYPKGSVIHIRRCMADIADMRAAVLEGGAESVGAKRINDVESRRKIALPSERDGDEELMEGGSELLSYVEQVEAWLCALCSGPISAFPQLTALLEPGAVGLKHPDIYVYRCFIISPTIVLLLQADWDYMENELMAQGGFEGAWGP